MGQERLELSFRDCRHHTRIFLHLSPPWPLFIFPIQKVWGAVQENTELRRQHAEAEARSSAAELRQRVDAHKQVSPASSRNNKCSSAFQSLYKVESCLSLPKKPFKWCLYVALTYAMKERLFCWTAGGQRAVPARAARGGGAGVQPRPGARGDAA